MTTLGDLVVLALIVCGGLAAFGCFFGALLGVVVVLHEWRDKRRLRVQRARAPQCECQDQLAQRRARRELRGRRIGV